MKAASTCAFVLGLMLFTLSGGANANAGTRIQLDNVEAKVPEPSTLAALGFSLFAAGWARRRRNH